MEHLTPDRALEMVSHELRDFFMAPNALRSVLIMVASILLAVWISKYLAKLIIHIAQSVAVRTDNESDATRAQQYREIETYLSITIAGVRAVVVVVTAYLLWRFLSPTASTSMGGGIAAIGASALFIVFAGQSLGMLMRDLTAGAMMITEKWFNIGDFVKIEPFIDVSGVVERMTLRSTKIRTLSGEVVWIHNQQIQAAHVSPKGVRTLAVDIFVRDRVRGERALEEIINTIPTGPTMLASPLKITYAERWGDDLWRISVIGQTLPGREWLIESHFTNLLEEIDRDIKSPDDRLVVYKPIVRFADPDAERKFRRAVRVSNRKKATKTTKTTKKS